MAKVDATTGKEIWRTVLENGNVSGAWVGAANLNILPDGNIPIAFGNHLVKLDGDTGRILKHIDVPADAPPEGSNFKHLTIAPDGTLIIKNQTRRHPVRYPGNLGGVSVSRRGGEIAGIDNSCDRPGNLGDPCQGERTGKCCDAAYDHGA